MPDNENCSPANKRTPWNKGKLIGSLGHHSEKAQLNEHKQLT